MRSPLLSAALIVRNEERLLEDCLRSLAGRVDEIVVVDTGSTDRSRDIARDLGAHVHEVSWNDDFAAARNAAIEFARGDWILYIDADERVVDFERPGVEALLSDASCACCTVLFRPRRGYTRYREHRLFRNRPDLRFRGVIHETLLPALEEIAGREHVRIGRSAVAIDHLGYDGDLAHKHDRNLPLLHVRLRHDPAHVYSWCHLGTTLLALGDAASAEEAWSQGIAIARTLADDDLANSLPYLHQANLMLDQGHDAIALLEEACRRFPDNHALAWLRGRSLMNAQAHAAAMPIFAALAAIDPAQLQDGVMAFDASIFGANAHAAAGLCAFRLGRYAESEAHYARAEHAAPADPAFRAKRMLARAKAQPAAGA